MLNMIFIPSSEAGCRKGVQCDIQRLTIHLSFKDCNTAIRIRAQIITVVEIIELSGLLLANQLCGGQFDTLATGSY